jgi:hypothetical protein
VHVTSDVGGGFPDLAVAFCGRWYLVEVKDGLKPPSGRLLTNREQEFRDMCPGDYYICEGEKDVLKLLAMWENS